MNYNIAVIPGDGIGPEVTGQAIKILEAVGACFGHSFRFIEAEAGGCAIEKYGHPLPQQTLDTCRASDSVLLGAVGGWQWDTLPGDKRPEQALLGLRGGLGLYANLRPAMLFPALRSACVLRPDIAARGVDMLIVRELTGGIYFGKRARLQTPQGEAAFDTEMYSEQEVRRIAAVAFAAARARKRHVTSVDKANILASSQLWRAVVTDLAKEYPDVVLDHLYVDNAAMQLIRDPGFFDVIVTSNMFGDILSDEAGQITGSIGMLPSASLGQGSFGLYEPVHGSAPDLAGKELANPIATILSAAMMLKYSFKLEAESAAIERAVDAVLAQGIRTADIMTEGMRRAGTREMGQLIIDHLMTNNCNDM